MHLAQRAYVLLAFTAVLAIAAIWSPEPMIAGLWRWPAMLLLGGVALEAAASGRRSWHLDVAARPRAFLGSPLRVWLVLRNDSASALTIECLVLLPSGFDGPRQARRLRAVAHAETREVLTLLPMRLGAQRWPGARMRALGRFGLIWWSREQSLERSIVVAPDIASPLDAAPHRLASGARPWRGGGAGSELRQLRTYVAGDPLSRIDWKATARARHLISRELSEDQHLDVLVAIDAGRASRIRIGRIDRLGLYANVAARFAETATRNDDRVGLLVFCDRPLAVCAPQRGRPAVLGMRRTLEQLAPRHAESDPLDAAIKARRLLKHRSLIVLLTDLEDPAAADSLLRAARVLTPPHLVVVAGIESAELAAAAAAGGEEGSDPWVVLAAREQRDRARRRCALLARAGVPALLAPHEELGERVLAQYERLRRARRV